MNYKIRLPERAFPRTYILLKPNLFFNNVIGRPIKHPNANNVYESTVNLAMPHSDEAQAKTNKYIKIFNSL